MISAALLALLAGPARAHHNKGLPHYGYFENYPQVPTEEFIHLDGRWEVGATLFNFQGLDARETSDTPDDVKFFVYIYDLDADRSYQGPVDIEIIDDRGAAVGGFGRLTPDSEGVYVSRETLPASGDYALIVRFEVDGAPQEARLPFAVDLAVDRVRWGLITGMGAAVGGLFLLALAGRQRRLTRRAAAPASA